MFVLLVSIGKSSSFFLSRNIHTMNESVLLLSKKILLERFSKIEGFLKRKQIERVFRIKTNEFCFLV